MATPVECGQVGKEGGEMSIRGTGHRRDVRRRQCAPSGAGEPPDGDVRGAARRPVSPSSGRCAPRALARRSAAAAPGRCVPYAGCQLLLARAAPRGPGPGQLVSGQLEEGLNYSEI